MEVINIDTLNQISRCKNNFKSVGRSGNLREICDLEYTIDFHADFISYSRMRNIVANPNNKNSLPRGAELKEPLYYIVRR